MPAESYKKAKEKSKDDSLIEKFSGQLPYFKERRRGRFLQHVLFYMASDFMEKQISDEDKELTLIFPEPSMPLRITYKKDESPIEFSWDELNKDSVGIYEIKTTGAKIVTGSMSRTTVRLTENKAMVVKAEYDISTEDGVTQSEYLTSQHMEPLKNKTTLQLIEVISTLQRGQREAEEISES